jgi:uncharacterized protein (TIGR02588 family)
VTTTTGTKHTETNDPHWIEWVTGLFSAVLVISLIGFVGKAALMDQDTSPDLSSTVVRTEARSDGYQILFEISNKSSETAAGVVVHGEIVQGGTTLERTEITLDYVPGRSRAKGGFIFRTNPDGKDIRLRAAAFSEP